LWESVGGISRKLEIGKSDALVHYLIGTDIRWRFETGGATVGHVVILIDAVAADSQSANERAVPK
jgi:hypothetical protein